MGLPIQEQLDNQHEEANSDCEGCHGAGWALFDVDGMGLFVQACDECNVLVDADAIKVAKKAGVDCTDVGLVSLTPAQEEWLKRYEGHKTIEVPILFRGVVKIDVPRSLSEAQAELLARIKVLASMFATVNSSNDALVAAFEQVQGEWEIVDVLGDAVEASIFWDRSIPQGVSGTWFMDGDVVPSQSCLECNAPLGKNHTPECGKRVKGCPEVVADDCTCECESEYQTLEDCIASGQHLQACDGDGFCENCGNQDPVPCFPVEWDRAYTGGEYSGAGDIAYVPFYLLDKFKVPAESKVGLAFEESEGVSLIHIIHYTFDERYTPEGEPLEE